jgi:hypothetical protein
MQSVCTALLLMRSEVASRLLLDRAAFPSSAYAAEEGNLQSNSTTSLRATE